MTIAFNTLFTALGKLVGGLNEWNAARGATLTSRVSTLRTQFNNIGPDLADNLTTNANGNIASGQGWVGYLGQSCWDSVRQAVLNDRPQTDASNTGVLIELVRQMGVNAQSLAQAPATVGSVTAVGVPTGAPTFVVSDLDALTQARSDWTLPDTLLFTGLGANSVTVQGLAVPPAVTYPTWPSGTGVNTTLTLTDASTTSIGSDPGFEQWLAGPPIVPSQWTIFVGTGGTTVSRVTDAAITGVGSYALQLLGDGTTTGTPLRVRQAVSVQPSTAYYLFAYTKRTANPANTGTLTVALRDVNGNLLAGTSAISLATSAIGTSWAPQQAALVTPKAIPTGGAYLEIRYNPGIGDTVELDQVALNPLPALASGGLRVAVVKGSPDVAPGDQWTLTTTATTPTLSLIRGLDRLMSLASYSARIPTGGAPSQLDALVS